MPEPGGRPVPGDEDDGDILPGGTKKARPKKERDAILEEARERYASSETDDAENRQNQVDDINFVYKPGEQWDSKTKARRKKWKEPCLEFNQLKQFVNQVVNDQRQNRPGIITHPAHGKASEETNEIVQGMCRYIEYRSKAEAAYDNGFQAAVVGARGWWRLLTDYLHEKSFDQEILIKPIADPLSVRAALDYQEPDGRDRKWIFIDERMSRKEFEARWPDADPISWDEGQHWGNKNEIIVVDYYRRVRSTRLLVRNSDGATGWRDEMPPKPAGVTEVAQREVEIYEIEWFKVAGGAQILEEYECPGEYIPVICCPGDDIMLEGKRVYQGLITQAHDSQAMFNFGMTQQAVHLALTPKSPWVAPQEAVQDYMEIWKNANTHAFSILPYKHKDAAGAPIPPPTRTAPSMPDAGWINWCTTMTGVMRSTIGMYENSLGMKSQELSGKAILAREKQGDAGTFHYVDNLHRAIALTGQIIVNWIPVYYDSERIVQIIQPDGEHKAVTINQATPQMNEDGTASDAVTKINDVTVGKYAVVIDSGPSYMTKRQETADKLLDLVKSFPPVGAVAGDLIVKSLDVADAEPIADRLKLMLPPQIQAAEAAKEQNNGKPVPPQILQKLTEMQGQLAQTTQAAQQLKQENEQLKSGAMVKLQAAKIQADATERARQSDAASSQQAEQQATFLADREAHRAAAAAIAKARLDGEIKIRVALIDRATKLQLEEMTNAADMAIAHLDNEHELELEALKPDPALEPDKG